MRTVAVFLRVAIAVLMVTSAALIAADVTVIYWGEVAGTNVEKTVKLDNTDITNWPLGNVDALKAQYFTFAACLFVAVLELGAVVFAGRGRATASAAVADRSCTWLLNIILLGALAVSIAMIVVFRNRYEFEIVGIKVNGIPVTWITATVALAISTVLGILDGVLPVPAEENSPLLPH